MEEEKYLQVHFVPGISAVLPLSLQGLYPAAKNKMKKFFLWIVPDGIR
jgi:hypothetical protein